jgi:hypothetical protein
MAQDSAEPEPGRERRAALRHCRTGDAASTAVSAPARPVALRMAGSKMATGPAKQLENAGLSGRF